MLCTLKLHTGIPYENPPHGINRQYPWLTIPAFSVPEFLLENVWQAILWTYSLFAWPTAIVTWHSCDFLRKHHNTSNETLENGSVTSFNPLADTSLWIGMLVFANDDNLYDKCCIILEFHHRFTLTSRAVTCITTAMQNNVLKLQGSALCKQTAMSHMCVHMLPYSMCPI